VFLTKVFRECFLNYVFQLCLRCYMNPFNDYVFVTDGAFARNKRAHPEGVNQLRLFFWRTRHVSRSFTRGGMEEFAVVQTSAIKRLFQRDLIEVLLL
jgi:hypothetical protein